MFENLFTPSPLVWTGLIGSLAALPILIHLINMLRHKRVKWAAMDFLLQSYKRQRNWIWLKQLILLLARMALLLLALLMLANVGCDNQYTSGMFGSQTTHHYVLLDDSFSMSDKLAGSSVFDSARQALTTIAAREGTKTNQRMTLIRFSQAAIYSRELESRGATLADSLSDPDQSDRIAAVADINEAMIDSQFQERLEERRNLIEVSQLATGPQPALTLVRQLIDNRPTEQSHIHLLSDFRAKDWQDSSSLQNQLQQAATTAQVHLVRCAEEAHANLAIVNLVAVENTRAAAVPFSIDVHVKNFGSTMISNLNVKVTSLLFDPDDQQDTDLIGITGAPTELPTVFFTEIEPGETAVQRFSVYFAKPGQHVIEAALPDDVVATDNVRRLAVRVVDRSRVLLIDDQQQRHAFFLSSAFEPDASRPTGVTTEVETVDYLRSVTADELQQFTAIYLLDVSRMDDDIVRKISDYASAGGGVAFFVGPKVDTKTYTDDLYQQGAGIFPIPLERIYVLPERESIRAPDIVPSEHPLLDPLKQSGGALLDLVQLETVLRPPPEWQADADPQLRVVAWVRREGEYPLIVEKKFGEGRVVAVLTTAAPLWHNWNKNPTFVIALFQLQNFLAQRNTDAIQPLVGNPVEMVIDAGRFKQQAQVTTPPGLNPIRTLIAVAGQPLEDRWVFRWGSGSADGVAEIDGIYELWPQSETIEASRDVFRVAVNVDPAESDLKLLSSQELSAAYAGPSVEVLDWNEIKSDPQHSSATTLSKILLLVIALLLIFEPVLAYLFSYHPRRKSGKPTAQGAIA
jgi:hypothetical protein